MLKKYSNFCPVPWRQFASSTNGLQRMCCMMHRDETHGYYMYKDDKKLSVKDGVEAYLESDSMKLIQDQIRENKQPSSCACYHNESILTDSKRTAQLEKYAIENDYDVEKFFLKNHFIDYYDIRTGNTCNLQCLMCAPSFSNQLYEQSFYLSFYQKDGKKNTPPERIEQIKDNYFRSNKHIELEGNGNYDWADEEFFDKLEKRIDETLERDPSRIIGFYIIGGEPLLNKTHLVFLERLLKKGYNNNIDLEYNTNMTVSDNDILGLWSNFRKITLAISIDDIGERYEYIRYPAKWSKILNNLSDLEKKIKENPTVFRTIAFATVINLFTVDNFSETERVAESFGLTAGKLLSWGPDNTTPMILTPEEKLEFIDYIPQDKHFESLKKYVLDFKYNQNQRDLFFKMLNFWDSRRRTKFKDTYPNLASVLKI